MASEKLPKYTITNVVATFNLGKKCKLDICKICEVGGFFEYNPKSFAAATGRLKNPKCSGLFFASGSVVLTGAASESKARLAAWCFVGILRQLGCDVTVCNFKIENIVCNIVCGKNMHLCELHAKNSLESNYMPVLFPGLIYRYPYPKIVFVVFLTGKVIATGAKVRQQLDEGWKSFYHNKLKHYFSSNTTVSSSSEYRIRKRKEHDNIDQLIRRVNDINRRIARKRRRQLKRKLRGHFISLEQLQKTAEVWQSTATAG